jgi:hypothetical protein
MAISTIPLASAYPSPDLSAGQLAVMIAIPVTLLFAWLALVYLAARSDSGARRPARQRLARQRLARRRPAPGDTSAVVAPDAADEDAAGVEPQLRWSTRA